MEKNYLKQARIRKNNAKDLSLFLSCSVSLVLISVFVLIDIDKFTFLNSKSQSELEDGAKMDDEINSSKQISAAEEVHKVSCYRFVDTSAEAEDLSLSENAEKELNEAILLGSPEIPQSVRDYLQNRKMCGFARTLLSLHLDHTQDSEEELNKLFSSFLKIRANLKNISDSLQIEVEFEHV